MSRTLLILSSGAFLAIAPPAAAQGITPYTNFETPQLDPIQVVHVGSTPFLLVCNTPDNAVEIYSIGTSIGYVGRIAVGLEPVSVVAKPGLVGGKQLCYTANWLGDSITIFELAADGSTTLVRTQRVGDEPMGLAFEPLTDNLVVTFSAPQQWAWLDPTTLAPLLAGSDARELLDAGGTLGLRDPRAAAFAPADAAHPGALFILNFRGGNDATDIDGYDWDVFGTSNPGGTATPFQANLAAMSGTGSTNFDMAFAANGDLYIASQHARNKDVSSFVAAAGESVMRGLVTSSSGFVTSQLVRVKRAGNANYSTQIIDLNALSGGGAHPTLAITQPTDVVVYGSGADNATRVFVAGFGSDSLGVWVPTGPTTSTLDRIDLSTNNPFSDTNTSGTLRGPRAMALYSTGVPANDRLFVLNRLSHSITVLNPASVSSSTPTSNVLQEVSLHSDPTPSYITSGRKFLYSARLSATGTVSCASCHVEGNTDFLSWNLADNTPIPVPPGERRAGLPSGVLGPQPTANKGPMVTQPLRGLVNFEVIGDLVQDRYFSNKPYHWRGDRAGFNDFNGAFVNLMAIANPFSTTPAKGISDGDMDTFRRMANSIHYPPNPNEPVERVYSGAMVTDPSNPGTDYDSPTIGSAAQLGMKQFHIAQTDVGISCVACHALPDGSNNRLTESMSYSIAISVPLLPSMGSLESNNIESAQLKGLVLKEKQLYRLDSSGTVSKVTASGGATVATGEFGLFHTGKHSNTIDGASIAGFMDSPGFTPTSFDKNAMNRFLRELDSGVAPEVGQVRTVNDIDMTTGGGATAVNVDVAQMEKQTRHANAGLAVHARIGGVLHGFWFDVANPAPYREVPHAGVTPLTDKTRADLLAFVDPSSPSYAVGNLLVFEATTLGSARRIAFLDGGLPPVLGTSAPSSATLEGCVPATHNALIPNLSGTLYSAYVANSFVTGAFSRNFGNSISLLLFEAALKNWAGTGSSQNLGLNSYRHEPPRRFVVSGSDITEGAWVKIYLPNSADQGSATQTSRPTVPFTEAAHPNYLHLPIYAYDVDPADSIPLVWQTAAEMEPLFLLELLCGSREVPSVLLALQNPKDGSFSAPDQITSPPSSLTNLFDPLQNNWYFVEVYNDPANPVTKRTVGWKRLKLQ